MRINSAITRCKLWCFHFFLSVNSENMTWIFMKSFTFSPLDYIMWVAQNKIESTYRDFNATKQPIFVAIITNVQSSVFIQTQRKSAIWLNFRKANFITLYIGINCGILLAHMRIIWQLCVRYHYDCNEMSTYIYLI